MKKLITMFLAVALCMGLAAPAFATNGYEEITFEAYNDYGTELVGEITIDQARQVGPTRYEVPAQVTVTVTIYENRSETYLLSLRYFNETVYEGGGTSEKDVSYAMLNADGSWTEYDGRPSYEEMNAHPLSPNQPYTFTLQTDLADVVAIDCGDTHDFFTAGVVKLRCSDGAAEQPTDPSNPFTDVAAGAYYVDAVKWAVDRGVTAGTSATTFSPDNTCTRGQIVTFLYRNFAQ